MRTATWRAGERHGATTANVKRYIDFAARHGFQAENRYQWCIAAVPGAAWALSRIMRPVAV